ncbi:MAG: serine/threonine protein kinase [Planctomycetales bacterium]|nr:serine/threonine protein kinase [Planctomycetales bacterium]
MESEFANVDEAVRRDFERAWREGLPHPIESVLPPPDDPAFLGTLEELVHIELEFLWRHWSAQPPSGSEDADKDGDGGRPARIEQYVDRFPLLTDEAILGRLIEQEYGVRAQFGDRPTRQEYAARFPRMSLDDLDLPSISSKAKRPTDEVVAKRASSTGSAVLMDASAVQRVWGDYEILDELGRGGMGVVYRARQRAADRIVALKVIREDFLKSLPRSARAGMMERFRNESQAAARLDHPNIVTLFDAGEFEGQPYYSMQYVDGESLSEMVRRRPLETRQAARYMEMVAAAVHSAHEAGVLHRDLKPQNILVTRRSDSPMVADFGLAKLATVESELTQSGQTLGTPSYMAPEQGRDAASVGPAADIYGLGATLYHLITGRPPFQAATAVETLRQVLDDEPVSPLILNRLIDRDVVTICLKCLAKEPAARYVSAMDLASDLQRYLRGEPIVARPISTTARVIRFARRKPLLTAVMAVAGVAILAAFVVGAVGYRNTAIALQRVQESQESHRRTIEDLWRIVSDTKFFRQPHARELQLNLLRELRTHYEKMASQGARDPRLMMDRAKASYRVARIGEMLDDTHEQSRHAYSQALQLATDGLAASPDDSLWQVIKSDVHIGLGRVHVQMRDYDVALENFRRAIELRESLAHSFADAREYRRLWANALMDSGLVMRRMAKLDVSAQLLDQAQAIRLSLLAEDPTDNVARSDLAIGQFDQAQLELELGNWSLVEQHVQQAIPYFQQLITMEPEDEFFQDGLIRCLHLQGQAKIFHADRIEQLGQAKDARQLRVDADADYERAIELARELVRRSPEILGYTRELAGLLIDRGTLARQLDDLEAAQTCLDEAIASLRPWSATDRLDVGVQRDLAAALRGRAAVDVRHQDFVAAQQALKESLSIISPLREQSAGTDPEILAEYEETGRLLDEVSRHE